MTENITLTIRLVRSFEYRTFKNLLVRDVPRNITIAQLQELVQERIKTTPGFRIYQNNNFDTLKIFMLAHGSKTSNLIINLDHDPEWILQSDKTLQDYPMIENETEISFINRAAYETYKAHPETKW